jgi:hypothetical protein
MTSPKQRKKRLAVLRAREQASTQEVTTDVKTVETQPPAVVESPTVPKAKKTKSALVELKSQDQVVEQEKEEVKTQTGE